jgi:CBS domain-containing protein
MIATRTRRGGEPAETVGELMTSPALTVGPNEDVRLALQMMLWGGCRHLPVVEDGRLLGLIGEWDVAILASIGPDTPLAVRDVMVSSPATARAGEPVGVVARRMSRERIDCVPVVDDERLVGIVTSTDVVNNEARRYRFERAAGSPSVSHVMTANVASVYPDSSIERALGIMLERNVRHVPVVDDRHRVVGMVSDRDVRAAVGDPVEALDESRPALRDDVESIMTNVVMAVHPDTPVDELGACFLDDRVGAVPVVDDADRLIGIVSYVDVLHYALRGLG